MKAYAKLNLALSVGPPEQTERGVMHPIASWMHAIDLADRVELRPAESFDAQVTAEGFAVDWSLDADLGVRALRALERHLGRALPARLRIDKRIPPGTGLGGGSSDAAAVLKMANEAFDLGLGLDDLRAIGAGIGSDIPFFIDEGEIPGPAIVEGFGDRITRVERSNAILLLLLPRATCPTGAVYRAYDDLGARDLRDVRGCTLATCFNDLTEAACLVAPEVGAVRDATRNALGNQVHVTGSGSALFTFIEDPGRLSLDLGCRAIVTTLV
ncbi:MAG: hypothetical protein KDA28_03455 [Phycisphaerales bacterium]|nr:hypothetical protein [Phycisphaerales bacterium]